MKTMPMRMLPMTTALLRLGGEMPAKVHAHSFMKARHGECGQSSWQIVNREESFFAYGETSGSLTPPAARAYAAAPSYKAGRFATTPERRKRARGRVDLRGEHCARNVQYSVESISTCSSGELPLEANQPERDSRVPQGPPERVGKNSSTEAGRFGVGG